MKMWAFHNTLQHECIVIDLRGIFKGLVQQNANRWQQGEFKTKTLTLPVVPALNSNVESIWGYNKVLKLSIPSLKVPHLADDISSTYLKNIQIWRIHMYLVNLKISWEGNINWWVTGYDEIFSDPVWITNANSSW